MIPAEAVEAAKRVAYERYGSRPDTAYLRTILEAAAPRMLAPDPVVSDEMVDAALEYAGTPRRRLFEYPHRDDDSRDMIAAAETLVQRILSMRPTP